MPKTPPKAPAILAAGALLAMPLTSAFEGLRTHPNPDPSNPKLMQDCYGDTQIPMRIYTADECKIILQARLSKDYAPGVLKCVPALAGKREAFAASIDFAYNAGVPAFCKSPMARKFRASDWRGGCNAFAGYYVTANHKRFRGLVRRRDAERSLCLEGVR